MADVSGKWALCVLIMIYYINMVFNLQVFSNHIVSARIYTLTLCTSVNNSRGLRKSTCLYKTQCPQPNRKSVIFHFTDFIIFRLSILMTSSIFGQFSLKTSGKLNCEFLSFHWKACRWNSGELRCFVKKPERVINQTCSMELKLLAWGHTQKKQNKKTSLTLSKHEAIF